VPNVRRSLDEFRNGAQSAEGYLEERKQLDIVVELKFKDASSQIRQSSTFQPATFQFLLEDRR